MNIKATLSKLDEALGIKPVKTVKMTQAEFETYVTSELTKAKADAEGDDKEKGAMKAKKRLEHLRAVTKLLVAKAEGNPETGAWTASGGENGLSIPVYEEGFEPPTYMPTEEGGDMLGGKGTQGDGQSFAAAGGAQGYNDAKGTSGAPAGTTMPASGTGTQADNTIFSNPMQKALGELASVMKGLTPDAAPPAAPVAKAAGAIVDDPSVWPKDLANKDFLKEGVAKRDGEWGVDPWASVKGGA